MLVFGLISPHPPIILPEVGGDNLANVHQTIAALQQAVGELAASSPQKLIIISPHEGHGFEVPERFLSEVLPESLPVERILVTQDSYRYYFDLGKETGKRVRAENTRYAIVASGDLSHVLKADGPYGLNPAGAVLDELIVAAVEARDAEALLAIDPSTVEDGAECGLRSILFLLGALDGMKADAKMLSYEGPFGVGYMVATFASDAVEENGVVVLARKSIQHFVQTGQAMPLPKHLNTFLMQPAGAFVSLHETSGQLRGCIGTIAPTKPTLAEEVITNAVAAASADPRFAPVEAGELDWLKMSVDVLSEATPETDLSRLDPKEYGIIVSTADGRRGVLLPDIEGVDTVAEQIKICRQKGDIRVDEPVTIEKFTVERFED